MKKLFIISISIILLATACKNDKSDSCNGDYDQNVLFINMADQQIIPAFNAAKQAVESMDARVDLFLNEPDLSRLEEAQDAILLAYEQWQKVEYFSFGPSESAQLNSKMNNFPVNTALLEANISFGQYDLDAPDNYYSGFPALDYLFFGMGADNVAIVDFYDNGPQVEGHKLYTKAVSDLMVVKLTSALEVWQNGYRATFVENTGTADGTAISLLINTLNENFERTRRDRLGIPSGYHEINVPAFPERTEAFYSGHSLALLKANILAAEDIFNGGNGEGLDDYLEFAGAMKDGIRLEDAINNQFDAISTDLDAIPESLTLSESIANGLPAVQDAYVTMANQVVMLKTDTPSALCVSITYVDNASDSD